MVSVTRQPKRSYVPEAHQLVCTYPDTCDKGRVSAASTPQQLTELHAVQLDAPRENSQRPLPKQGVGDRERALRVTPAPSSGEGDEAMYRINTLEPRCTRYPKKNVLYHQHTVVAPGTCLRDVSGSFPCAICLPHDSIGQRLIHLLK